MHKPKPKKEDNEETNVAIQEAEKCPNCGSTNVERRRSGEWSLVCFDCGYSDC